MTKFIIIEEKDFEQARKEIRKNLDKVVVFSSNKDELNRKVLEKEPIKILLLNQSHRKDRIKQRSSGFNQVMARIARKNNVKIGINLDEIIFSKDKRKAEILARVAQNIRLCNKNKVEMVFVSKENKRDIYDLKSLGLVLGMPTWMTRNLEILI